MIIHVHMSVICTILQKLDFAHIYLEEYQFLITDPLIHRDAPMAMFTISQDTSLPF